MRCHQLQPPSRCGPTTRGKVCLPESICGPLMFFPEFPQAQTRTCAHTNSNNNNTHTHARTHTRTHTQCSAHYCTPRNCSVLALACRYLPLCVHRPLTTMLCRMVWCMLCSGAGARSIHQRLVRGGAWVSGGARAVGQRRRSGCCCPEAGRRLLWHNKVCSHCSFSCCSSPSCASVWLAVQAVVRGWCAKCGVFGSHPAFYLTHAALVCFSLCRCVQLH
jgi:hypothetical protein